MIKTVHAQSKTNEAKKRVDIIHYKDYGKDQECPMYFGMWLEWFGQYFLNYFGHEFNLNNVKMIDSVSSGEEDRGVDGHGETLKNAKKRRGHVICAKRGYPVEIQVKATLNPTKEYKTNDGSRLANFMMNAMSTAIINGFAYNTRYILFTSGRGLHYKLAENSNGLMEIINYNNIIKLFDDDWEFLNHIRRSVGLDEHDLPELEMDLEAKINAE